MKDDLRGAFIERLNNPVYFTFFISWVGFNWPAILFMLKSDKNIEYFISTLKNEYFNWSNGFWYPFGIAVLVLFAVPFIQLIIEFVSQKASKWRRTIKNKITSDDLKGIRTIEEQKLMIKITAEEEFNVGHFLEILNLTLNQHKSKSNIINRMFDMMTNSQLVLKEIEEQHKDGKLNNGEKLNAAIAAMSKIVEKTDSRKPALLKEVEDIDAAVLTRAKYYQDMKSKYDNNPPQKFKKVSK